MTPKALFAAAALGLTACTASPLKTATPALPPVEVNVALKAAVEAPTRSEEFRVRDAYRHPQQTLEFFGIQPEMTVVEVWPGTGWYTEILAPYLRERGRYVAAGFVLDAPDAPAYYQRVTTRLRDKLASNPALYDRVSLAAIGKPDRYAPVSAGSADAVLTFRNVHNWLDDGNDAAMFQAFFDALKSGGTLGIVEHRAAPGTSLAVMKDSGYVTEAKVIELAEAAGFKLAAKSEINANPLDTKDHPKGVWTLPPSLAFKDVDRAKYVAIGESDRMTLRFVKP